MSTTSMGRPKSYDRADVLRRATELFWDKGYEGTHLAELVTATGLNRFSLYNEFGGKAGLFEAALESYVAGLGELTGLLEREPLGLANVRRFHRAQLDHGFRHGCFALNTVREKHVVPEGAWQQVEAFTSGLRENLQRNLEAAQRTGELGADQDAEVLATVLAVFDMGLLSFRGLGAEPAVLPRLVEQIERLLC